MSLVFRAIGALKCQWICAVAFTLIAVSASAQVTIHLPLDGYYRPGRYMPVTVQGRTDQPVTLSADGVVKTVVSRLSGGDVVTPILTLGSDVGTISGGAGISVQESLKPLQARDVLIGIVGGSPQQSAAKEIVPGSHALLVQLDPAHPLPGPPLAWQSLDAIVLDQWPGGFPVDRLPDLLAGGMTVAVTATSPPDATLPWRPFTGGWVMRPNLAGPLGCDGNDDAYMPSGTWHPDLSSTDRMRIGGIGVIVVAALSMIWLLPRWRWPIVAMVIIGVPLLPISGAREFRAVGEIQVRRVGWEQSDRWTYFAGPHEKVIKMPIDSAMWPIFLDSTQASELDCELHDDNGLSFQFRLPADHRLAFVQRYVRPAVAPTDSKNVPDTRSPMARLAQALYRDAGTPRCNRSALAPAVDNPNPLWPTVQCGE